MHSNEAQLMQSACDITTDEDAIGRSKDYPKVDYIIHNYNFKLLTCWKERWKDWNTLGKSGIFDQVKISGKIWLEGLIMLYFILFYLFSSNYYRLDLVVRIFISLLGYLIIS